jgi:hypothetical protein
VVSLHGPGSLELTGLWRPPPLAKRLLSVEATHASIFDARCLSPHEHAKKPSVAHWLTSVAASSRSQQHPPTTLTKAHYRCGRKQRHASSQSIEYIPSSLKEKCAHNMQAEAYASAQLRTHDSHVS